MSELVKWWDLPRVMGIQGAVAFVQGTRDPILCPKCKSSWVVYNGNYFCDGHGDTCDWALPHPTTKRSDRKICDLIGTDYS